MTNMQDSNHSWRYVVGPRTIVDKAKDSGFKAKDKAKDLSHKAKAKDLKFVLKDRSRPRPRTNKTAMRYLFPTSRRCLQPLPLPCIRALRYFCDSLSDINAAKTVTVSIVTSRLDYCKARYILQDVFCQLQ